jgi:hypothetical protein
LGMNFFVHKSVENALDDSQPRYGGENTPEDEQEQAFTRFEKVNQFVTLLFGSGFTLEEAQAWAVFSLAMKGSNYQWYLARWGASEVCIAGGRFNLLIVSFGQNQLPARGLGPLA